MADQIIFGTAGADVLLGLGGNDQIYGRAGPDILRGGYGDDVLDGGADFNRNPALTPKGFLDQIHAGHGNDVGHVPGYGFYFNGGGDDDGPQVASRATDRDNDIAVVHGAPGPVGRRGLINQFDIRDDDSANRRVDRIKLASSDSFDFVDFRRGAWRPDDDGAGWEAPLVSVSVRGELNEFFEIRPNHAHGVVTVESDTRSMAGFIDGLNDMAEDWFL